MEDKFEKWVDPNNTQKWKVRKNGTLDIGTVNNEPTRTEQQHADSLDANKIMSTFAKNDPRGFKAWWNSPTESGTFADFSEIPDFMEMQNRLIKAEESFMQMPLDLRLKFDNDPAKLIQYLNDPKNNEESIKLGLRIKKPTVEAAASGPSETTSQKAYSNPESKS